MAFPLLPVLLLLVGQAVDPVLTDPARAATWLTETGLTRRGSYWLSPDEELLERRLAEIPSLNRRQLELQDQLLAVQRQIPEQLALRQQATAGRIRAEQALAQPNLTDNERRQRQAELLRWRQNLQRFPEGAPLPAEQESDRLVQLLLHARHMLALATLEIARLNDAALQASYAKWHVPRVVAAILLTGPKMRLGPRPVKRVIERGQASDLQKLLLTNRLPVLARGQRRLVGGYLNDREVVWFEYRGDSDFSFVSAAALEAAGVTIPADAPRQILTVGNKALEARRVIVPELRLGQFVLHDVPMVVLPENEFYLTPQLGADALRDYVVKLDEAHRELLLQPKPKGTQPASAVEGRK